VLPRVLDEELLTEHRLSLNEYVVLMNLSEEPRGSLRMTDLATRVALSPSGVSRVVGRLASMGLVSRMKCPSDGRGYFAVLSDVGLARLRAAYPTHLRGIRQHVINHLTGLDLRAFADAVGRFAGDADGPPLRDHPAAGTNVGRFRVFHG
jgi:DNA-binding MarR family transcriptional regulator